MRPPVGEVVRAQRRRRRLIFWAGFAVLAALGGAWAGLTTEPLDGGWFGDAVAEEVGVEVEFAPDIEMVETTAVAAVPAEATTVTVPPTTGVLATGVPTTAVPTTTATAADDG